MAAASTPVLNAINLTCVYSSPLAIVGQCHRSAVLKKLTTATLEECQHECDRARDCRTIYYRATESRRNCLLRRRCTSDEHAPACAAGDTLCAYTRPPFFWSNLPDPPPSPPTTQLAPSPSPPDPLKDAILRILHKARVAKHKHSATACHGADPASKETARKYARVAFVLRLLSSALGKKHPANCSAVNQTLTNGSQRVELEVGEAHAPARDSHAPAYRPLPPRLEVGCRAASVRLGLVRVGSREECERACDRTCGCEAILFSALEQRRGAPSCELARRCGGEEVATADGAAEQAAHQQAIPACAARWCVYRRAAPSSVRLGRGSSGDTRKALRPPTKKLSKFRLTLARQRKESEGAKTNALTKQLTKQGRGGGPRGFGSGYVATRHGDGSTCSARPAVGGGAALRLPHSMDVHAVYACGGGEVCLAATRGVFDSVVLTATSRDGLKVRLPLTPLLVGTCPN